MSSPTHITRLAPYREKLIGQECLTCGNIQYPPRKTCIRCGSRNLKLKELPRYGKVVTYTLIYYLPEGYDHIKPKAIAIVELANGVRVFSELTDVKPTDIKTGMEVEAVLRLIKKGGSNEPPIYGIKFRPRIR